jgi:hypothetical protein
VEMLTEDEQEKARLFLLDLNLRWAIHSTDRFGLGFHWDWSVIFKLS